MTMDRSQPERRRRQCSALCILTAVVAILGPISVAVAAVIVTVVQGDWWSEMFWVYVALFTLIGFTSYLSLLAFLWELTRHIRRKAGDDLRDTSFTVTLHHILIGVAVAGIVTVALIPLILLDRIEGFFVLIHFAFGGFLAVLYVILGVHAVIRRIMDHRRAETQRLAEEKQAWEGYLS